MYNYICKFFFQKNSKKKKIIKFNYFLSGFDTIFYFILVYNNNNDKIGILF